MKCHFKVNDWVRFSEKFSNIFGKIKKIENNTVTIEDKLGIRYIVPIEKVKKQNKIKAWQRRKKHTYWNG